MMTSNDKAKRAAGFAAVDRFVRDDTCIGLGTGSTAYWAVARVGELVAQGLKVRAVTTSLQTEHQCAELHVPTVALCDEPIDVAIDGADEATATRALLKGGGGALFREKAVALAAQRFVAIVTESKMVLTLGRFPLPVEVVPFSLRYVRAAIERYGIPVAQRLHDGAPYVSDNGNAILDCAFGTIEDPARLDAELRAIHGVVATGLFVGIASVLIVAGNDGTIREM
jgi:ribose 5-phosphate isomerase A